MGLLQRGSNWGTNTRQREDWSVGTESPQEVHNKKLTNWNPRAQCPDDGQFYSATMATEKEQLIANKYFQNRKWIGTAVALVLSFHCAIIQPHWIIDSPQGADRSSEGMKVFSVPQNKALTCCGGLSVSTQCFSSTSRRLKRCLIRTMGDPPSKAS